jgi:outer membrane protein assembly factor BamB
MRFVLRTVLVVVSIAAAAGATSELERGEALREAARAGDLTAVRQLLDAGTPVDEPARHGVTALRVAAEKGHRAVVELLVDRGANIDAIETFFGSSVLATTLGEGHRDLALWLVGKGAKDRLGALEWALENDDVEFAKAVIARGPLDRLELAALRAAAAQKSEALQAAFAAAQPAERVLEPFTHDPARLAEVAGTYRSRDRGDLGVVAKDGGVEVTVGGGAPQLLVAVRDRVFESPSGDRRLEIGGRGGIIERAVLVEASGEVIGFGVVTAPEPSAPVVAKTEAVPAAERTADRPWRQFRGPHASGNGDGQGAPATWDVASGMNVRFKTPVPGIALASPIVDGGRIFVATAVSAKGDATFRTGLYGDGDSVDDTSQHSFRLLALSANDGKILWDQEVAGLAPTVRRHLKSSLANSTPVTDGERVVVLFGTVGVLAAYDRDGKLLWRRDIGVLEANDPQSGTAEWGHASSPVIWRDLVIVQADRRRESYLAAYRITTGEPVWRVDRAEPSTWATPTVVTGPSGDELVTNGTTIRAYDPATGALLWHLGPNSEVVVATPVVADGIAYVTAGYPPVRPVYAIRAGSRGDLGLANGARSSAAIAWSHGRGGTYLPTPILYRGHLVTLNNNGILTVYRADTGEEVHRARVGASGTSFSASPVAADGRLYLASEEGEVFVLRGEPGYEQLAVHAMGEVVMATPAIAEGLMVVRTLGHVVGLAAPPVATTP